jgi:hypothetical protein
MVGEAMTDKPAPLCPGCGERATVSHFQANPDCVKAAASLFGIYNVSKRKSVGKSTGRPPVLKICRRCGAPVSTTEARRGHEGCTPKVVASTPPVLP